MSDRAAYRVVCLSGNVHLVIAQSITGVETEMRLLQEEIDTLQKLGDAIGPCVFKLRIEPGPRRVREVDRILRIVAKFYDMPTKDIKGKLRTREIVRVREVVAYLCRTLTNYSYPDVGRLLGGRHHTSVITQVRRVRARLEDDTQLQQNIKDLEALILPVRPGEARQ